MALTGPQCAFPPHPGDDDEDPDPGYAEEDALARFERWYRESPLDHAVPVTAPLVWTAAEIMHLIGVSGWYPAGSTAAAILIGGWAGQAHVAKDENRVSGGELAAVFGLAGGWLTAATITGPLAWGFPWWMSIGWLAATLAVWRWLGGHRAVTARRDARQADNDWIARKTWWHADIAPLLGLTDWHLQRRSPTLLGEELLICTSPQGKPSASEVLRGGHRDRIIERLAHHEDLEYGAVDIDGTGRPGQVIIRIRRRDPWDEPIWHPLVRPGSPFAHLVPVPDDVRRPQCIGLDPETGAAMTLTLWDKRGGKVIMILAAKDGGKTTLLDSITERITACPNARLLQLNLSKALEDSWWADLADANALDLDVGRAFGILRFVHDGIRERPRGGRHLKVHQPTAAEPLYVLKIDEIDAAVAADPVRARKLLGLICGKCRGEGFTVILAGQRGIQAAIGGGGVQMNIDIAVWGKFARTTELAHVAGRDVHLPDMGSYGGSNPGVFAIARLPFTGELQRGRTWYWGETDEAQLQIVEQRRAQRAGHRLEPALGPLAGQWEKITRPGPYTPDDSDDWDDDGYGGDLQMRDGEAVPGPARIKEKIAVARELAAASPDLPELPPDAAARLRAATEEDHRRYLAAYTDVNIPAPELKVITALLARPGGTSSGEVAAAIGKSRSQAHRYLAKLADAGHAEAIPAATAGRGGGFRAPARGPAHLRLLHGEGDSQ